MSRLSSNRSGKYTGSLYRAVNSKDKSLALGDGVYFTDSEEAAQRYGSEVREFNANGLLFLGRNSREYDTVKAKANSRWQSGEEWFDSMADAIAKTAEHEGYDGIFADSIFGLVVFRKSLSKIRENKRAGSVLASSPLRMGPDYNESGHRPQDYTDAELLSLAGKLAKVARVVLSANPYLNTPPTKLKRDLKSESDSAKKKQMTEALNAWRLTVPGPFRKG